MQQTSKRKSPKSKIKTTQNKILNGLLLTIIISTACTTTTKRDQKALRVLKTQYVLLQKLKNERSASKVSQKISEDDSLTQAETHLQKSIEALMKSTKVLKEAMQND